MDFSSITFKAGLFFMAGAAVTSCSHDKTENTARPNILLIVADDMGYSDLGCYGGEIKTPNLDRLASQGIRFTQFYNAARCCPSRASILTGLYPHQAGMGGMVDTPDGNTPGPYQGYLNDQCVTIAEVLKQAGYYTAASGKWHVGEERPHWPTDRGFDNYYGLISGASNYFDFTRHKNKTVKRYFAIDSTSIIPPKEGFYMTDAITDHAIGYLKKAAEREQPFFLYLAYTAPHWPLHALQEDIDKYRGKYLKGWDALRKERLDRMVKLGIIDKDLALSLRDPEVQPWDSLTNLQKDQMDQLMAIYAAQIDRMDQGIGKVLEQLDTMGASQHTLVLFLSDNGACAEGGIWGGDFWGNFWDGTVSPGSGDSYHTIGRSWANLSNTPFRLFKHWVHEGGISTPFIARWPERINKGAVTNQPGHIIDLMATCCDITGASYPSTYKGNRITATPGKSLLPIFRGAVRPQEPYYWEHFGNRAIREGKWKVVAEENAPWELYDMKKDRTEQQNLIAAEPDTARVLIEQYKEWAHQVGVKE